MHHDDELLQEPSSREVLVTRAIDGDEDAFRALYAQHAPHAWRLAYALTGTRADAVTIVSESFAHTFTALRAGFGGARDFSVLLLESVRHRAIDVRRERGTAVPPFEAPDDAMILATAFASLPERWRAALWLDEVEDMAHDEIASIVELDATDTAEITDRARSGLREQYLHNDVDRATDRNCGRAVTRLTRHVEGSLPASDSEKLERHLSLCPACAERCVLLAAIGTHLARLVPPLPAMLEDDARVAWTGTVVTTSGLALSSLAQKALAGVAAVAAGVGVIGAAIVSVSDSGDDEAVAPIAPIVTELAAPRPPGFDIPVDIDLDPTSIPGEGGGSPDQEFDGVAGASARNETGSKPTDLGIQDRPASPAAPAGGHGNPSSPDPAPTPGSPTTPPPEPSAPSDAPMLEVGTTVGDIPVAVEVGTEPGVTVGPISVGSEPQPGSGTISVDGPLAPLAPVVGIVDGGLSGLLGG